MCCIYRSYEDGFNPLTQAEGEIRAQILSQIPLGTQMDDAIYLAKNKKRWSDIKINDASGYESPDVPGRIIGKKYFSIHIGEYHNLTNLYFQTDVRVYFAFNQEDELINVKVRKMTDAL